MYIGCLPLGSKTHGNGSRRKLLTKRNRKRNPCDQNLTNCWKKQMLKDLSLEEKNNVRIYQQAEENPTKKKIVYNNSSKKLTADQEKLLELGLNFSITPRKFPLLEYIAAAEDLCQSLEGFGDDESIDQAQKI